MYSEYFRPQTFVHLDYAHLEAYSTVGCVFIHNAHFIVYDWGEEDLPSSNSPLCTRY